MAIIIDNFLQGTELWMEARAGNPGASEFKYIVTSKGERVSKSPWDKFLRQMAGEIIRGIKEESYQNKYMTKGIEREDESRSLYELINDVTVEQVGLVYMDEQKMFHCSPDGLIGADGGYETKNAETHIQIGRLLEGWPRSEHYQQVQGSLYVTGRKWWDLMSYCRGIKPVIIRFERDEVFIQKLEVALRDFTLELAMTVKKIKEMEG